MGASLSLEENNGVVIPSKRWIVERPFAWRSHCRRLAKDEEILLGPAEPNMMRLARLRTTLAKC